MGNLVGHVAPGSVFFFAGLWHLFNHIKLYILQPDSYTSLPWFPTTKCRHLELLYIMVSSFAYIVLEFVIGFGQMSPLDPDGSIPAIHLHNLEHSLINSSFLAYSILALALDLAREPRAKTKHAMTYLLLAMALAQQLQLFYHHSVEAHSGPEGQYHSVLVLLTFVALIGTLMSIILPNSFMISFMRSLAIIFIGLWFVTIGVVLWTPSLVPKNCFMVVNKDNNQVVRCSNEEALHRANSLVNLQFGFLLIVIVSIGVSLYVVMVKIYGKNKEYIPLMRELESEDDDHVQQCDVESQERSNLEMVKLSA